MGAKFPDARHTAVAGFLFLRFLCPAVVAPESHGELMALWAGLSALTARNMQQE